MMAWTLVVMGEVAERDRGDAANQRFSDGAVMPLIFDNVWRHLGLLQFGGGATGTSRVEARGAATHPIEPRTAPQRE